MKEKYILLLLCVFSSMGNYLTTSNEPRSEKGMNYLAGTQLRFGYTAREFNHSHPGNSTVPSGITDNPKRGRKAGEWGDIRFARQFNKAFGKNVKFNIFTPKTGIYHPYSKNSKKSDYPQYYGKKFHGNTLFFKAPILEELPQEADTVVFYKTEYRFKDTSLYNQLCSILFRDSIFGKNFSFYCAMDYNDTFVYTDYYTDDTIPAKDSFGYTKPFVLFWHLKNRAMKIK